MENVRRNPHEWFSWNIKSSLLIALEEVSASLEWVQETLAAARFRINKEHRRVQEAIRDRESRLASLLTDPFEAIVLTDDARRVLAANHTALTLFGVSRKNVNRFTIDTFLPEREIPNFEGPGPRFLRGPERRGECVVTRLDGRSKVVEFSFQANFIPGQHLSRFREVTSGGKPNVDPDVSLQLTHTAQRRWKADIHSHESASGFTEECNL